MRSHFRMQEDDELAIKDSEDKEFKARSIHITKDDLKEENYGMTPGCKGCEGISRGLQGAHNERCRLRIETEIENKELERYTRVLHKLSEYKL